jgi:hypothetical protein
MQTRAVDRPDGEVLTLLILAYGNYGNFFWKVC